nr:unnamed protein product [Ipomoea batatas]
MHNNPLQELRLTSNLPSYNSIRRFVIVFCCRFSFGRATKCSGRGNKSPVTAAATAAERREWRRRKLGRDMMESHCLDTHWRRRTDLGGNRSRISINKSSIASSLRIPQQGQILSL